MLYFHGQNWDTNSMLMSGSHCSSRNNLPLVCSILEPVKDERRVFMCYTFSMCDKVKSNSWAAEVQWLSSWGSIKSGSLLKNMYADCSVLCSMKARINVVEASGLVLWGNTHTVIPGSLSLLDLISWSVFSFLTTVWREDFLKTNISLRFSQCRIHLN